MTIAVSIKEPQAPEALVSVAVSHIFGKHAHWRRAVSAATITASQLVIKPSVAGKRSN